MHKKPYLGAVIGATAFFILFIFSEKAPVFSQNSCHLLQNKPYKTLTSRAVYYITESCTRKYFTSPAIFFSHFQSWKNVLLTIDSELSRVPLENSPEMQCALEKNKPYKSAGNAVYYVTDNCKKKHFPDSATYFTYFDSWSVVQKIMGPELNSILYEENKVMAKKEGVNITKNENVPTIKPVDDGTQKVDKNSKVWITGIGEKILPGATSKILSPMIFSGAKNEFVSFQVAIPGPANGVVLKAYDLISGNNIISSSNIKLYKEELINLVKASGADGFTGKVPDALIPDIDEYVGEKRNVFPFNVTPGETKVIWVDVHIPENANPGTYQGKFVLSTSEGSKTIPYQIEVWNFKLPSTSSIKNFFGLSYPVIPAGHKIGFGSELIRLRGLYTQLGLDHRISLSWFDDGNFSFSHIADTYGKFLDGTAPTILKGAELTTLKAIGNKKDFATKAKEMGWWDKVFDYTCDEPPSLCNFSVINPRNEQLKQIDNEFKHLVTVNYEEAVKNRVVNSIDILTPVINHMHDKPGTKYEGDQRSKYLSYLSGDSLNELWMYQSCMSHGCDGSKSNYTRGWTSYAIDKVPVKARSMGWYLYKYGVSGELYYESGYAFTQGDPWVNQYYYGGNGDGTLFYPGVVGKIGGKTDIPIASIRLKLIRAGYQDYEYLKLLEKKIGAVEVKKLVDKLFPNPWTQPTSEEFEKARISIGELISGK